MTDSRRCCDRINRVADLRESHALAAGADVDQLPKWHRRNCTDALRVPPRRAEGRYCTVYSTSRTRSTRTSNSTNRKLNDDSTTIANHPAASPVALDQEQQVLVLS